ncbi:MAG: radical SAM family heme chaperone HemW [Alphaproteobacteria bacterium]|nr:radical SAM family heme chaperone HemW [Alphaproteobacteria bacterium]
MTTPHNIYIHVPYCASKCDYCAFHSVACNPDWPGYADKIISEIKYWGERLNHSAAPTIFFGGGTPSLMPTNVFIKIMDAIRTNFNVLPDVEITLESNPGTLDAARLREFIDAGVNRLSVGVQSLNDDELKFLGRRHTAADAIKLIEIAHNERMRVSGDFIYALPNQTVSDIEKMCHGILNLNLKHASIYELSIEPGTPLAARGIQKIDNELSAEMYETIGRIMLPRYEISNYAVPGFECRHNQNIWNGDAYVGIGPSACGRPHINGVWYEQENEINPIDDKTRATEKVITGLRTARGVALTPDVINVINWDFVDANPNLFIRNNNLSLSSKGMLILDGLLVNLITDRGDNG